MASLIVIALVLTVAGVLAGGFSPSRSPSAGDTTSGP